MTLLQKKKIYVGMLRQYSMISDSARSTRCKPRTASVPFPVPSKYPGNGDFKQQKGPFYFPFYFFFSLYFKTTEPKLCFSQAI